MANGPGTINTGVARGTGLAAAGAAGLNTFTEMIQDLARFNLTQKARAQEFERESALRQSLLQQQIAERGAQAEAQRLQQAEILSQQQQFRAQESAANRAFQAEQAKLDRANQKKLLKLRQDEGDDFFADAAKRSQLLPVFNLDPKDPTNLGINTVDDLQAVLSVQSQVRSGVSSIIGNKNREKEFFGGRLNKAEQRELLELAASAESAPGAFAGKLQQRVAEIRAEKSRDTGPGLAERAIGGAIGLGSNILDLFSGEANASELNEALRRR